MSPQRSITGGNVLMSAFKVKSVIFVPRTPSSRLCKQLRAEEQRLAVITGYRAKVQERGNPTAKNPL